MFLFGVSPSCGRSNMMLFIGVTENCGDLLFLRGNSIAAVSVDFPTKGAASGCCRLVYIMSLSAPVFLIILLHLDAAQCRTSFYLTLVS